MGKVYTKKKREKKKSMGKRAKVLLQPHLPRHLRGDNGPRFNQKQAHRSSPLPNKLHRSEIRRWREINVILKYRKIANGYLRLRYHRDASTFQKELKEESRTSGLQKESRIEFKAQRPLWAQGSDLDESHVSELDWARRFCNFRASSC